MRGEILEGPNAQINNGMVWRLGTLRKKRRLFIVLRSHLAEPAVTLLALGLCRYYWRGWEGDPCAGISCSCADVVGWLRCCPVVALGKARRNPRSFYAGSLRLPSTNSTGQSGQLQHGHCLRHAWERGDTKKTLTVTCSHRLMHRRALTMSRQLRITKAALPPPSHQTQTPVKGSAA